MKREREKLKVLSTTKRKRSAVWEANSGRPFGSLYIQHFLFRPFISSGRERERSRGIFDRMAVSKETERESEPEELDPWDVSGSLMTFLVTCRAIVGSVVRLGLIHFVCYTRSRFRLIKFNALVVGARTLIPGQRPCICLCSKCIIGSIPKQSIAHGRSVNKPVIQS